jgi:hypothetical protein
MFEIGKKSRLALWSVLVGLFCLLSPGMLRTQEIRVIAGPNESIRMGRGGYVCEGELTHTPIDATENWTYEMVQCTGPMYNSFDYAALNAKQSHDELLHLNDTMDRLLDRQAREMNHDLKTTIESSFDALSPTVLASAEVQNLKKSLLNYVDQRVVSGLGPFGPRPALNPAPPRPQPRTTPPQPQP